MKNPPDPAADRAREEAHRRAARSTTLAPGESLSLTAGGVTNTFFIEEPGAWQVRARFELQAPGEPGAEAGRKLEVLSAPIELTVAGTRPLIGAPPAVKMIALSRALVGRVSPIQSASLDARGSFDRQAVARVLDAHLPEVSTCFELEGRRPGKAVLEWVVTPAGAVEAAKLRSSTTSRDVEQCLLAALQRWKFPPDGVFGLTLAYPFDFGLVPADAP